MDEVLFVGRVISKSVSLKAGADIHSETVLMYPGLVRNDRVDVLKIIAEKSKEPWCYVRTNNGVTGYVPLSKIMNAEQ